MLGGTVGIRYPYRSIYACLLDTSDIGAFDKTEMLAVPLKRLCPRHFDEKAEIIKKNAIDTGCTYYKRTGIPSMTTYTS
jgi:hypothetical protein